MELIGPELIQRKEANEPTFNSVTIVPVFDGDQKIESKIKTKNGEKEHYSLTNYDNKFIKTNLVMWKHCTLFMTNNFSKN